MNAQPGQTQTLKIENPARIQRILSKMCDAKLQVLVRVNEGKVAIRGRAIDFIEDLGRQRIRITDISDLGMQHMQNQSKIRAEFVGMSTKIMFYTTITFREQNCIFVKVPNALFSLERRKSVRFPATQNARSFLELSVWRPKVNDQAAPPVFSHLERLAGWIQIVDISEGGFCGMTRFPSVIFSLRQGLIDNNANIVLPMKPPLKAPLEVRWIKKIKERVRIDGATRYQKIFKFGVQFLNLDEKTQVSIRQYMHQLSISEAI